MASTTSLFQATSLEPIMRRILHEEWPKQPDDFKVIANVLSSIKNKESDHGITGLGAFVIIEEGEAVTFDDPAVRFLKEYTHSKYALGFRITEEMWDDDLYNTMKKMPRALARSAANTMNTVVINNLNNGFNAAFPGPDAVALFNAAHPLQKSASTSSNRSSDGAGAAVDGDLSVTTLEAGISEFERTLDDTGRNIVIKAAILVVPTELQFTAEKLLHSVQLAETANNDINAFRMKNMGFFRTVYLTDTDAWFMRADQHEMNMFMRKPFRLDVDLDFDTSDMKHKGSMRFSSGFSDWRGWFGNPGV